MSFITKTVSNYKGTRSAAGKIFIGISGATALLSAWNYFRSVSIKGEY